MSDDEATDAAMQAIKDKMAADPNFDPMTDPESMKVIEAMIPESLRDMSSSIARFEVALKDALGEDEAEDLDVGAASFEDKKDLVSSPVSAFFKDGLPEPTKPFDSAAKADALKKLMDLYPEVAFE